MSQFFLAGDPVAHSRSPRIHKRALEITGRQGSYEAVTSDEARLKELVADLRSGLISGINVTMPLKGVAAQLSDRLTSVAERSGSVNALRLHEGHVEGHSTDALAFEQILDSVGMTPAILVLGSGDSARAALAVTPTEATYVSARSETAASALHEAFGATPIRWGVPVAGAVVINATSLGMWGERLPVGVVALASCLVDLPYGQQETSAVGESRRNGIRTVDGLEFLARQASASFEWWTGDVVDFRLLEDAARNV